MSKDIHKPAGIKIIHAAYLDGYRILILFSNNRMKFVDFTQAIKKYAKGEYSIFANKNAFKKFSIENGTLAWGENWDLIFPVMDIFNGNV
jgi:hypothetical protein